MKFLFDDESFSFEALRAAGYAARGGADLGEVLVACANIPDGDEEAWCREWGALADRIRDTGLAALAAGHRVSARDALLRASNYYRTAEFFRRADPDNDHESARLARLSRESFAAAAELLDVPARRVAIPYESTSLPGYLFLADDSGAPRPTLVYHGGFDSTLEESYFAIALGGLERGYTVLAFDGPGQATARRLQGLVFRPDWEKVVTPVIDYAAALPEVDEHRMVLMGTSFGGYLAARAAAFEHRIAALVLNDGLFDFGGAVLRGLPQALPALIEAGRDAEAEAVMAQAAAHSAYLRWAAGNSRWTFGATSAVQALREMRAYTMAGIADRITCPTLVLDPDNDQFFRGEPRRIFDALRCPKELITFTAAEGAGEHCQEGAGLLTEQRVFDRLDALLR
ncbi:alpha/beta fold hydrolase [Trebonia sp.]|uniref:alpha/beta hydrolase family protein n=1 Tax=Trebonia sp. TaxID=2767075 RepID=UPI0026018F29|nr:alpha/beta fold hydrolase [Trebonia sp.]